MTIISGMIIFYLLLDELWAYMMPNTIETLTIDNGHAGLIEVTFNITMHHVECTRVHLDLMDASGTQINDVTHSSSITKQKLDLHGVPIGYAVKGDNHFQNPNLVFREMVMEALGMVKHLEEGCNVAGSFRVRKVAGNFHTAVGLSVANGMRHEHKFGPEELKNYNCSHTIHSLSFGPPAPIFFKPIASPLEGVTNIAHGLAAFQYIIKLVPTIYHMGWFSFESYQYSVTEFSSNIDASRLSQLPGVFFLYDLTPFTVNSILESYTFLEFLTSTCAILGGVILIMSWLDALVFQLFDTAPLPRLWSDKRALKRVVN